MTCLYVELVPFVTKHGRRRIKRVRHTVCDECKASIVVTRRNLRDTGLHFCSKRCSSIFTAPARMLKVQQTSLKRYGVSHHLSLASVKEKRHQTLTDRYGNGTHSYTNVSQIPRFKETLNTPAAALKRHETMKRNGTYRTSKAEDACYEWLCMQFGEVERQIQIKNKRWLIDFYVKSIDTYVQFDGVYWHGLDRSIEEIRESKSPRDVQIHKKWLTDREQDRWFATQGLNLVRINDQIWDRL